MKKGKSTAAPAYDEVQSCNSDGAGLPQHDENVLLKSSPLPSALDSSGFLICIMAMDTTILHVNGAHATALGYDSGELVGSKGMEIVHPEDRARLLPLLARYAEQFAGLTLKNIFAGGSTPLTETVQYRVQNKSGQWHWLEGVDSIIENRIYALSRDITSDFNTQIPHKQIMAGLWKSSAEHKTSEEELIQQLLNAVGPAMGVSRACYNTFSDGDAPGGELACRMEWCAEGIKPSIGIKMPSLLVKHTLRNELFLLTPTAALENLPVPLRPMAAPLIAAISKHATSNRCWPCLFTWAMKWRVFSLSTCALAPRISPNGPRICATLWPSH